MVLVPQVAPLSHAHQVQALTLRFVFFSVHLVVATPRFNAHQANNADPIMYAVFQLSRWRAETAATLFRESQLKRTIAME
jgi:hypothetical protein